VVRKVEYDSFVKWLNPATLAVLVLVLFVPAAFAQSRGVPASVTSTGFGGSTGPRGTAPSVTSIGFGAQSHRAPAMAPSVTSLGFQRGNPGISSQPSHHPQPGGHPHRGDSHHGGSHHPHQPAGGAIYAVPYYYPYAYDAGEYDESQPAAAEAPVEDEYMGGPTIFDRRGPGTGRPWADRSLGQGPPPPAAASKPADQAEDESVSNQPDTLLVFKDGHQLAVSNYAIVGTTLFDLSEGHHHKIPLAELNLTATAKENDDRGIDFRLPVGVKAD
jgi:hypothetical protein